MNHSLLVACSLAVLGAPACATSRVAAASIRIQPSLPGWSTVTEPGWFQAELPGRISEGTATLPTSHGDFTYKTVTGRSSNRFTLVAYADVAGWDGELPKLAQAMMTANNIPGTVVTKVAHVDRDGLSSFDLEADVPPNTSANHSPFAMHSHVLGRVNSRRCVILVDIRAKDDTDDHAVTSFRPIW